MMTRRNLLANGALLATGAVGTARAALPYGGPNVIIVRFGGGVRRRETIDPGQTYSPYLIKALAQEGTLYRNMLIDDAPHVETSHGQGTLYLLTGRYDELVNQSEQVLGERFEPPAPTLFEYLRRAYGLPSHQALILNGEDRTGEEFYTFSNHHDYGIEYRSEVLSLFRFKAWLARKALAEGAFASERARLEAAKRLAEMQRLDVRRSEADGQGPALDRFWEDWHALYGPSGFVNARGDRLLTELARRAMVELKPRLMLLNYQDPDYVHWGYAAHYTRAISIIDQSLRDLKALTEADPFYRDNTYFIVVPDCGRDDNPLQRIPYQHHFNSRSAREIWALLVGPRVPRGRTIDREVQQIDVARTVAQLMDFAAPDAAGELLYEALA
jgi:hypothetical protein